MYLLRFSSKSLSLSQKYSHSILYWSGHNLWFFFKSEGYKRKNRAKKKKIKLSFDMSKFYQLLLWNFPGAFTFCIAWGEITGSLSPFSMGERKRKRKIERQRRLWDLDSLMRDWNVPKKCVCHLPFRREKQDWGRIGTTLGGGRGATLWNNTSAFDCASLLRV